MGMPKLSHDVKIPFSAPAQIRRFHFLISRMGICGVIYVPPKTPVFYQAGRRSGVSPMLALKPQHPLLRKRLVEPTPLV